MLDIAVKEKRPALADRAWRLLRDMTGPIDRKFRPIFLRAVASEYPSFVDAGRLGLNLTGGPECAADREAAAPEPITVHEGEPHALSPLDELDLDRLRSSRAAQMLLSNWRRRTVD